MEEKSAYRKDLESRLDRWRAELDDMKDRARDASGDARADHDRQVDRLRAQEQVLREKLKELDEAHGDAWQHLRQEFDAAWNDFASALRHNRERVD